MATQNAILKLKTRHSERRNFEAFSFSSFSFFILLPVPVVISIASEKTSNPIATALHLLGCYGRVVLFVLPSLFSSHFLFHLHICLLFCVLCGSTHVMLLSFHSTKQKRITFSNWLSSKYKTNNSKYKTFGLIS
jgi:hypothetical protein